MELVPQILLYSFAVMFVACAAIVLYSQSLFHFNKYRVKTFAENFLIVFSFYTAMTVFLYVIFELIL